MDDTTRLVYAMLSVGVLVMCGLIVTGAAAFMVADELKKLRKWLSRQREE